MRSAGGSQATAPTGSVAAIASLGFDGDGDADHGLHYVPESVYAADAARVVRGEPAAWTLKRNPRVTFRDCGARLFIDVLALRLRGSTATSFRPGVLSRNSICGASSRFDPSKTAFPISSRGQHGLEALTKQSIGKFSEASNSAAYLAPEKSYRWKI